MLYFLAFLLGNPLAELDKLQGAWVLSAIVEDGKEADPGAVRLIVKDSAFTMYKDGKQAFKGTLSVDGGKLDMILGGKPLIQAAYRVDGTTLYICWSADDARQKEVMIGAGRTMVTYKRKKD